MRNALAASEPLIEADDAAVWLADVAGLALQLCFRDGARARELPLIISLHDRGGDAASALALARSTFGAGPAVLAPQAARPCNPMQSNARHAPQYAGYSWYLGERTDPEAASFGDVLSQLELLVTSAAPRPVVLLGFGQGAVLAVTLALHGVPGIAAIAVDRVLLPRISNWSLPALQAATLPCAILDPGDLSDLDAIGRHGLHAERVSGAGLASWLERSGATAGGGPGATR